VIPDDPELRRSLVKMARRCERLGMVSHAQGNLSARITGADCVLITPSGLPYADMEPEDIVAVDLEGHKIQGVRAPSSEWQVHTLTYRRYSGVGAGIHVESPYVNALYTLDLAVPNILGNFVYLFAGRGLAIGPSIRSGTQAFAETTLDAMGEHFGVVWKNHGMFCVGQDLDVAFNRCVAAEQAARVYYLALSLQRGEPDLIPQAVQEEMVEAAREKGWTRPI
jgi:ribulose-5-phosphate 4-epimerase/fuculose-1-phosphate aldolase